MYSLPPQTDLKVRLPKETRSVCLLSIDKIVRGHQMANFLIAKALRINAKKEDIIKTTMLWIMNHVKVRRVKTMTLIWRRLKERLLLAHCTLHKTSKQK